jgi:hypothetical protein
MTTSKRFCFRKPVLRLLFYSTLLCFLSIATFSLIFKRVRWVRSMIRQASKSGLNPLVLPIAGKSYGPYAVIQHTGRHSGRLYTTPVLTQPIADGFIIPMTYGREADWACNILATGSCTLLWQGRSYNVGNPEVLNRTTALALFSWPIRLGLSIFRIARFLKLTAY